jgi:hypothetical protein
LASGAGGRILDDAGGEIGGMAEERDNELDRWLRTAGARFLRLGWVDSAGVLRTQAVSRARATATSAEGLGVISGRSVRS